MHDIASNQGGRRQPQRRRNGGRFIREDRYYVPRLKAQRGNTLKRHGEGQVGDILAGANGVQKRAGQLLARKRHFSRAR